MSYHRNCRIHLGRRERHNKDAAMKFSSVKLPYYFRGDPPWPRKVARRILNHRVGVGGDIFDILRSARSLSIFQNLLDVSNANRRRLVTRKRETNRRRSLGEDEERAAKREREREREERFIHETRTGVLQASSHVLDTLTHMGYRETTCNCVCINVHARAPTRGRGWSRTCTRHAHPHAQAGT